MSADMYIERSGVFKGEGALGDGPQRFSCAYMSSQRAPNRVLYCYLILRKITKFVVKMSDFKAKIAPNSISAGAATPDPARRAYSAPPDP